MKLYGFNNLTKTLSFNIYDICYTRTEEEKKQYIQYIDEVYNAERLTNILTEVSHIIGANILNIAKQDYDPQGASVTILISEEEIEKEDIRCRIETVRSQVGRTHPVASFGFDVLVHGFRRIILKTKVHPAHLSCLGVHRVGCSPKLASNHAACIQAPSQSHEASWSTLIPDA